MGYLLYNGIAVTGGTISEGIIRIEGDRIKDIILTENSGNIAARILADNPGLEGIDLGKRHVFAGGIDAHVHFREPGMTHKADMASESAAAVLGGVTSFIDMPNTNPPTVTVERLLEKLETAKGRTYANYGFHLGATNGNAEEIASAIKKCPERFGGIKVFLGSSTGNMLVNDKNAIEHLFRIKEKEILVHCEDESIIRQGLEDAKEKYGEDIPFRAHSEIRSREACLDSSMRAVDLAMKYGTRLHMLHISTSTELLMLYHTKQRYPAVTVETSANYLWFTDKDYDRLGSRIKCNPSIKTEADRMILRDAFLEGTIDTIGTDHAPHTEMEKEGKYTEVPSGMPSIQQSFQVLLTLFGNTPEGLCRIASAFSEKPAEIFGISGRGSLKTGNYADIVVVDSGKEFPVTKECLAYKCGWSPYEGARLKGSIDYVFVNGRLAVREGRLIKDASPAGRELVFTA